MVRELIARAETREEADDGEATPAARAALQPLPLKTFTLRGIKNSRPYLRDGRLFTLEDTVEFFNFVLGTQLSAQAKTDRVAYLRRL
jgi:cytochrome c peroxidase